MVSVHLQRPIKEMMLQIEGLIRSRRFSPPLLRLLLLIIFWFFVLSRVRSGQGMMWLGVKCKVCLWRNGIKKKLGTSLSLLPGERAQLSVGGRKGKRQERRRQRRRERAWTFIMFFEGLGEMITQSIRWPFSFSWWQYSPTLLILDSSPVGGRGAPCVEAE